MKFLLIAMACLLADLPGRGLADCDEDRLGQAHLSDLNALCTQERNTSWKEEASSNQRQASRSVAVWNAKTGVACGHLRQSCLNSGSKEGVDA